MSAVVKIPSSSPDTKRRLTPPLFAPLTVGSSILSKEAIPTVALGVMLYSKILSFLHVLLWTIAECHRLLCRARSISI